MFVHKQNLVNNKVAKVEEYNKLILFSDFPLIKMEDSGGFI